MNLVPGANYYELFVYQDENVLNSENDDKQFGIGLSEKQFYEVLNKINATHKGFKYFQREYKEYVLKNLVCQCFTNDEVKVMKKKSLDVSPLADEKFIQVAYNKTKLTLVNFDSTKNLHQISYIKKLIFRVSNRIYINFEISIDSKTKTKSYMIYINYNHDDNVDFSVTEKSIKELISMLK